MIIEPKISEFHKKHVGFQLYVRKKEMACLHEFRHCLNLNLSEAEISTLIFEYIALALQYPKLACISIKLGNKKLTSDNYTQRKKSAALNARICSNEHQYGQISVFYLEEKLFFIPQEQYLINAIANDIGWWFERRNEHTEHFTSTSIYESKDAVKNISPLNCADPLTHLPNKRQLIDHLKLVSSAKTDSRLFGALLFIDIDNFKSINDLAGYDIGDHILYEISNRIRHSLHTTDIFSRFGGDEFVIMLPNLDKDKKIASQKSIKMAERIRRAINKAYIINQKEYLISPSVGISIFGKDDSLDNLLKQADAATYQAKELGGNRIHFFNPSIQKEQEERALLELELRHALQDKQLQLYYQIQINSENLAIGVEALIRWHHPNHGFISPQKFISLAEESCLSLDIGQWIIDKACKQLSLWKRNPRTHQLSIAINISNRQFHEKNFVERISTAINTHDINPSLLKLELTEGIVMDHVHAIEKIKELRKLGVKLSLDDFGTGYSSLSYLKKLEVDQLKIDQSFVRDISIGSDNEIMVRTIISLANNFKLDVLAEGVETEYQLAFLKANNCTKFQGYLFGKPLPIADIDGLLNKYPSIAD